MVYHKILNVVPCAVGPCRTLFIHFTYESAILLTPNSLPPSLPHLSSPLATTILSSVSVSLLQFHRQVHSWVKISLYHRIHSFSHVGTKITQDSQDWAFYSTLREFPQFDIDSFSFIPFYPSFPFCCTGIQLRCLFLDHSHVMGDCCVSCSSYLFLQPTVMECQLCLGTLLDTCNTDSVVLASVQQPTIQGKKKWFVAFPDFHGETTPNVADSKLSM